MIGNVRLLLKSSVSLSLALIFLSCANQIPPPGGPIDTTPPTIISVYPRPNTLHYSEKRLDLAFDKYVDHRSVEESIFISPYISDLEFDWSGKDVEVTFSGELRKNTTYVVTVGTDVTDLRSPPNHLAQSFTFAFSTGSSIDRGGIRGRIFPMKPQDPVDGVMIFAYRLTGLNPDTLDPRTQKPDYITQTGKGGEFFLRHLAFGPYRIIAIRDQYRNLLYDPEVDEFGVPPHDYSVTLADTLQDDVLLQMAKEDTSAPRLISVDAKDRHHIQIEFSEFIDTSSTRPLVVSVTDTLTDNRIHVFSVYPELPSTSKFTVVTGTQDSTKGYLLAVDSVRDLSGNPANQKASSLVFTGSPKADTLLPRVTATSVKDSTRGIVLRPTIQILFSDAVNRATLEDAVTLQDGSGNDIPSSLTWLNDAACTLRSRHELSSKSWYRLVLVTYNGKDWDGRSFRDSLSVIRFETLDAENLSSIEGTVVDTNAAERNAPIIVIADRVDQKPQNSYSTVATQNGSFTIAEIEEGRYVVHAFRDRNSTDKFDPGRPFPYVGSERFGYAADTLKVRARWPLEGVHIELE